MPSNLMTLVPTWLRQALGLQELQLPNALVSPDVQPVVEIYGEGFASPLARYEERHVSATAGNTQIVIPRTAASEQAVLIAGAWVNTGAAPGNLSIWLCPPGMGAASPDSILLAQATVAAGASASHVELFGDVQAMPWVPIPNWAIEWLSGASDFSCDAVICYLPVGRYPR